MATKYTTKEPATSATGGSVPGTLTVECGEAAFTTTGLTVAVDTNLTSVYSIVLTPKSVNQSTPAAGEDILFCDGTISSGQLTIERAVSGTSGLGFWYEFKGE